MGQGSYMARELWAQRTNFAAAAYVTVHIVKMIAVKWVVRFGCMQRTNLGCTWPPDPPRGYVNSSNPGSIICPLSNTFPYSTKLLKILPHFKRVVTTSCETNSIQKLRVISHNLEKILTILLNSFTSSAFPLQ